MEAIVKETQLWYCDLCDKTSDIKKESKQINSKTHIHKTYRVLLLKINNLVNQKLKM